MTATMNDPTVLDEEGFIAPLIPAFYQFTECRLNHRWRRTDVPRRQASWGFLISYECDDCKSVRNDTIDVYGGLSTRQYVYPEGYKLQKGVVKAQFRAHLLTTYAAAELTVAKALYDDELAGEPVPDEGDSG